MKGLLIALRCKLRGHYPRRVIPPATFLRSQHCEIPDVADNTRSVVVCQCGGYVVVIPRSTNPVCEGTF